MILINMRATVMVALSFYGVRLKIVCLFVFYAYFLGGGDVAFKFY